VPRPLLRPKKLYKKLIVPKIIWKGETLVGF